MWKGGSELRLMTPFCRDLGMAPFFRVLGMKNNENEKCHFKMFKIIWFLAVFVVDFSFSLCFTMILDAFLLKSCSGGPRRLWRSGSTLGGSGGAPGGPGRTLGGSLYTKTS